MSVFVCLSVCPRAYLRNCTTDFYEIFCACCIVYDSHSVHALHPTYTRFIIHHWLPSGADNNLSTQKFDTFINSCIIACLTFKLPCDKQPKCHNLSNLNVRQAIMQELLKNVVLLCWQVIISSKWQSMTNNEFAEPFTFWEKSCNFDQIHEFYVWRGTAVTFFTHGGQVHNHLREFPRAPQVIQIGW